jgi:hypothetical protein
LSPLETSLCCKLHWPCNVFILYSMFLVIFLHMMLSNYMYDVILVDVDAFLAPEIKVAYSQVWRSTLCEPFEDQSFCEYRVFHVGILNIFV